MKTALLRITEILNGLGFSLIVGSIVYFIIGNVTSVVHGNMLDWTFCGSAHHLFGVEWCEIEGHTHEAWLNQFIHRLMNVTLPWFMMFWGFVLVGVCSVLMKALEYQIPFRKR
jgi:hypothetical protein